MLKFSWWKSLGEAFCFLWNNVFPLAGMIMLVKQPLLSDILSVKQPYRRYGCL
jgi:hypothetical protein